MDGPPPAQRANNKNNTKNDELSSMLPTVHVTMELGQYPAFLVQDAMPLGEHRNQCLVQWASSLEMEWVPKPQVTATRQIVTTTTITSSTNKTKSRRRLSLVLNQKGSENDDDENDNRRSKKPTRVSLDRPVGPPEFDANGGSNSKNDQEEPTERMKANTLLSTATFRQEPPLQQESSVVGVITLNDNTMADSHHQERANNNTYKDAGDEEEVEFMWTIPPSPALGLTSQYVKKQNQQPQATAQKTDAAFASRPPNNDSPAPDRTEDEEEEEEEDENAPNVKRKPRPYFVFEPPPQQQLHEQEMTMVVRDRAQTTQPPHLRSPLDDTTTTTTRQQTQAPFPLIQSAYVQTLAEITYTIMKDARWRVQGTCLFGWDMGEDLSAILLLARLYKPLSPPTSADMMPSCNCLLCRRNLQGDNGSVQPLSDALRGNEETVVINDWNTSIQEEPQKPHGTLDNDNDTDDDNVRWLYLYCRLFHRRGPWFRLDDIYERYYKPKDPQSANDDKDPMSNEDEEEEDDNSNNSPPSESFAASRAIADPQPGQEQEDKTTQNGGNQQKVAFRSHLLPAHLSRVEALFWDLQELCSSGLIRSFDGEEECGLTIGQSSVISQEMRTTILAKLGLKQAKRMAPNSRNGAATAINQVWKQMNQQQSILASLNGGGSSSSTGMTSAFPEKSQQLLPVIKHVNALVIEKLALDILKTCCGLSSRTMGNSRLGGYIPSAIRKEHGTVIQQHLHRLMQQCGLRLQSASNNSNGFSYSIWRLRESPAMSLRRCCRLYLCATSGPGDMRSDESNGWKSLHENYSSTGNDSFTSKIFPLDNRVRPPGIHTWSKVIYPGSMVRFGLASALFQRAYQHIPSTGEYNKDCEVFPCLSSFHAWEMSAELRANVDYLIELHELMRYETRQQDRRVKNKEEQPLGFRFNSGGGNKPKGGAYDSVDFLKIQTTDGRELILRTFLATFGLSPERLLFLTVSLRQAVKNNLDQLAVSCNSLTECETILVTLAIVIVHLLQARVDTINKEVAARMTSLPWLRHLWWEGCLAYILWDLIPICERLEMYSLAISALKVLLYGSACDESTGGTIKYRGGKNHNALATVLLSRRARGKALDRLVIDHTHRNRQIQNHHNNQAEGNNKEIRAMQKSLRDAGAARVSRFCESVLMDVVPTGHVTFSAIRGIARRLKRPLHETLSKMGPCLEAGELGLRLCNTDNGDKGISKKNDDADLRRYSDWTPITDKTVANALTADQETSSTTGPGSRCSYIGHEDGSLNVEQLAMEYYRLGNLPASNDEEGESEIVKGGWVGWHDEGGHVRALFRILCSAPLLGINWGCSCKHGGGRPTVHLTPYQGAPFDLHAGFMLKEEQRRDHSLSEEAIPSLYSRQRERIDEFLTELTKISPHNICIAVYDAIACRLTYAVKTGQRDPLIERDVKNLRTLSVIAAGFGGQQLAGIFRCFLFDYRHYSGGLPDLLLIRARYVQDHFSGKEAQQVVDLSDWIGESLSSEYHDEQEALRGAAMVADEEFLGCSKVGDSGGGGGGGGSRGKRGLNARGRGGGSQASLHLSSVDLPQMLELWHKGLEVIPECMMVEVKSSNDRLDGRQEDWLNVLDQNGNARVCKFENSVPQKRRKRPPPPKATSEESGEQ